MGGGAPDTSGQNDAARMNAEIAKEIWGQYKQTYLPMENQYVQDAQNYDTPEHREQYAEKASGDVAQGYATQREGAERNLEGMGVNPNSGAFAATNARLQRSEAADMAGAQNMARQGVENRAWDRKTSALSLGKGLPAQASNASAQSGQGYATAGKQQQDYNQQQSNNIGSMVGAGIGFMKDGGHVDAKAMGIKRVERLAMGGPAGLQQAMANNTGYAQPQGSTPGSSALQAAQMASKAKGVIGKFMNSGSPLPDAGSGIAADTAASLPAEAALPGAATGAGEAATTAAATTAAEAAAAEAATTAATAAAAGGTAASAAELAPLLLLLANGGDVKDGTAGGGIRGPGTETSDSIPAMLSDGEFVMNAESVKHFGLDKLNKMNQAGLKIRHGIKG